MSRPAFNNPVDPVEYTALSPHEQERTIHIQQSVLEDVALGKNPIKVIEDICKLAESAVPASVASCMLLNEQDGLLYVMAAPSVTPEAIARLNGMKPGPGAGSCGNAVYRQEPMFVENTLTDARWCDLRQLALDFNICACWSMPIRTSGGRVIGSFALSSFEHRHPGMFHRKLLEIGSHLIGIVLARQESEARIAFLASHDALTNLPNRALTRDRLEQAIARAQRDSASGALMFLDIDNFKLVNDTLGHATGDALLSMVAARLAQCFRETDSIGRQGGDEFLVVLGETAGTDAIGAVADKITQAMQAPFEVDGHTLSVSLSLGIAAFPADGTDPDELIRKADAAMYHAKDAGRNTHRFFNERMNLDSAEHLQLRTDMRRAIEQNEFVLHYQPQVDLASGAIVGVEALIRWHHPELGMTPPGRFIPIAEACGNIVPIGEWVLREACRQAAAWQAEGLPPMVIAVNLSAVQFRRGNLEETIGRSLHDSGLAPHWLELELTESILLQDTAHMLQLFQRLKVLGVKLSIDDFGTGYSSLSYLRDLAVDKLKIDQSFIRDMARNTGSASIVRAVAQMARSLHLRTIAEGVEDPSVIKLLREYGCDEAQGYHFAHPMPAEACAEFIRRSAGMQEPR
ncbi:EAL domain-containing protein [Thiobacillus sp.]|uniref:bifunctional diguanylate cyclase/phosphodiesterase n=1 Tax=Thiobacillus sp. TaxID=924 RepID=UPI0025E229E1|nr:EAL domain-containing protein [Thiobacillus sp.]MBT9538492.1 EAL domain-containing protein [Thiobacillus sp.]